jgi:hypothetical protein
VAQILEMMLVKGAPVDAIDGEGRTALMIAAGRNDKRSVSPCHLVAFGGDQCSADTGGWTTVQAPSAGLMSWD